MSWQARDSLWNRGGVSIFVVEGLQERSHKDRDRGRVITAAGRPRGKVAEQDREERSTWGEVSTWQQRMDLLFETARRSKGVWGPGKS